MRRLQFEYAIRGEICYLWPYFEAWGDRPEWNHTRQVLASFQGLREVRVKVDHPPKSSDESEHASEFMKHLMEETKANLIVETI